jgi:hypothetical protein
MARVALTSDPKGTNLPPDGAPWKQIGEINIERGQGPRIGASSDEIIELIERDGLVLWPFKDIEGA